MDERVHARRRVAEAVAQLVGDVVRLGLGADEGDAAVDVHAPLGAFDVRFGDIRADGEIGGALGVHRRRLAALLHDRLLEQLQVHIVPHVDQVARLLRAEQIARAAYLKVTHGDAEARVELGEFPYRLEPLLGDLGEHLVLPVRQVRAGAPGRAPDAAAYLVELGKAHFVRVLDDQRVDVRDVDARLDDRRAHEHLHLAVRHAVHDLGKLRLAHAAVGDVHGHVGQHGHDPGRDAVDRLDAVMQIIHLPAPGGLAADRVAHDAPVVLHHERLHGQTLPRRLLERGHIADAGQRHVQRAGDRRGREREHVHLLCHLLDVLLVGDAEALLLVHDQKPELFEAHVL